ncbi:MAG: TIGR00300 family protein [Spirochaetia bacterium]|jgi:lysine-ketoglutarate reductase/saccharopine dehydrogenase-like protein (TIGR00300 family)
MAALTRRFLAEGHIIDSGLLTRMLNLIVDAGADYEITAFSMGKVRTDTSRLEIEVKCGAEAQLASLTGLLVNQGCYEKEVGEALLRPAPRDSCVPDDFYATTNRRTQVYRGGAWCDVADMRMDGVIVETRADLACRLIRDVKAGEKIVCTNRSVRVFPLFSEQENEEFGFMASDVSSERSVDVAISRVAEALARQKRDRGRVIVVAGPVVIHTGGGPALAALVRGGYVTGLLAGNALAVHDLESALFGTSLGIALETGKPVFEGHRNHIRAINTVFAHGSIKAAVEAGAVKSGVMYECVKGKVPYLLAGSLRDDGPLPETEMNMLAAQKAYAALVKGADMVVMLSSMLHSIATGNMIPAWAKTICVDINPAVVTKLSDRGSGQTIGIVTDVGLFLRSLAEKLQR